MSTVISHQFSNHMVYLRLLSLLQNVYFIGQGTMGCCRWFFISFALQKLFQQLHKMSQVDTSSSARLSSHSFDGDHVELVDLPQELLDLGVGGAPTLHHAGGSQGVGAGERLGELGLHLTCVS